MGGSRAAAPVMRLARVIGAALAVWVLSVVQACYTLQPMADRGTPPLGMVVALDITDAGRAALGGSMGPEIGQIEGRLTRNEGDTFEIAVSAVRLLRGGEQVWKGEKVQIQRNHISRMYEKQLSKGRTVAASAVTVGVVAYFASKGLLGSIFGDEGQLPGDTAESRRRPPRP